MEDDDRATGDAIAEDVGAGPDQLTHRGIPLPVVPRCGKRAKLARGAKRVSHPDRRLRVEIGDVFVSAPDAPQSRSRADDLRELCLRGGTFSPIASRFSHSATRPYGTTRPAATSDRHPHRGESLGSRVSGISMIDLLVFERVFWVMAERPRWVGSGHSGQRANRRTVTSASSGHPQLSRGAPIRTGTGLRRDGLRRNGLKGKVIRRKKKRLR